MNVKATSKTPFVQFDTDSSELEIKGVSCPENPVQFYSPIIDELNDFLRNHKRLHILIQLDYFNTGSSKCILNILNLVSEQIPDKTNASVTWITEEEDLELIEAGKIFQEMSGLNFDYKFDVPKD
ncbi:MAG: DUF1987 domain-containing protein [Bacteroidetes bacterium]|nr:MAG: DUF1987 domain-containing protein [Bacteroidota bacterium]